MTVAEEPKTFFNWHALCLDPLRSRRRQLSGDFAESLFAIQQVDLAR
jgi:hypothetical protein